MMDTEQDIKEMPFGKYQYCRFNQLPDSYLWWLLSLNEKLDDRLKKPLAKEWNKRRKIHRTRTMKIY